MSESGVTSTAKASGPSGSASESGLGGGDLISVIAAQLFSGVDVVNPSVSRAPAIATGLSAGFNQTAGTTPAVTVTPTIALTQVQGMAAPPVTELNSQQAAVSVTPQDVKQEALGVSATVAQAKQELSQIAGGSPAAQGTSAPSASSGGSNPLSLSNTFAGLAAGGVMGFAANAVLPGAGAVVGVMTSAFQVAAMALHGSGTDATFMQPLSQDNGPKSSRSSGSYSRQSQSTTPVPSTPTPASQSVLSKLSNGPGFGPKVDAGAVALAGSSLTGIRIGGMDASRYANRLDQLDQQCQRALAACHTRETKGLVLDHGTFEQVLKRDLPLNQSNPLFVSGAAV